MKVTAQAEKLLLLTPKPELGWTWSDLAPSLRVLLVTTGETPPAGTGLHYWKDPTTDPGVLAAIVDLVHEATA